MEIVAHRAGNTVEGALKARGQVDMVELDVHVFRGQVEVRHTKVLRPTARLWERWYLEPAGTKGVPIGDVLTALGPEVPVMIDLKCFLRSSARKIAAELPAQTPVVASSRSWWTLAPFRARPATRVLFSCGSAWQLWWVLHRTSFGAGHGVCVHEKRLTESVIDALMAKTPLVFCWGARTAERCRELEAAGLAGVILDDYSLSWASCP